jgi:hypothetical protein
MDVLRVSCTWLDQENSMFSHRRVGFALALTLVANMAAAQTTNQRPARDSLWNGTLIGLGAGLASVAALDAAFCENGFGGCDFPWAAVVILGGIGAGAGAGIDFLIGRKSDEGTITLRISPVLGHTGKGVLASVVLRERKRGPSRLLQQQ